MVGCTCDSYRRQVVFQSDTTFGEVYTAVVVRRGEIMDHIGREKSRFMFQSMRSSRSIGETMDHRGREKSRFMFQSMRSSRSIGETMDHRGREKSRFMFQSMRSSRSIGGDHGP